MQGKMPENSLPHHTTDSNQKIIETDGASKRLYQVWKGSNKFCFGGRLIFGPDVRSLTLTVPLIVVPVIFFVLFVSDKLVNEFQHHLGNFIVDFAVVFTAYDILMLFLTSGRDPGIVPRNAQPPELTDVESNSTISAEWSGAYGGSVLPLTKDVFVNGIVVKVKYCNTCMLYRPPRCSHCSICNNCVERFDHHCPWVGQCIGRRNYRFFFMFVTSTTLLCLYVFSFCWVNLTKIMEAYHCNLWEAVLQSPVSGILIIYTFIGAWFVGGLSTFHLYLVCTNQTTYENFRYRYDGKKNPYNHGCIHNVKEILFSGIPKSMNNFRAITKEDSSWFSSSHSMGRAMNSRMMKPGFDLEIAVKRHNAAAEELEGMEDQFQFGAIERFGSKTPHSAFSADKGSWETPKHVKEFEMDQDWQEKQDMESLSVEFKMTHGYDDRVMNHEFA
ncbi:probable protein S-acyltransferase 6 [Zingiber officinale]|uniref:S-acyltransferase n=1 Tax=Zingiber officinale TaxID=94328 RepID=A0A8J5FU10_ZINOF|nr:probable protein S-acyltransferase 6 [Zingiber officinale]KAG6485591.1 hypothetical protein ZIOFF_054154 [Zingiber officinale]